MAAGKSNKEIGVQLFISERTVKTHIESLFDKLGVATRTCAVKAAVRNGLCAADVKHVSSTLRQA